MNLADRFARAEALDATHAFLEDPLASVPVDRASQPGDGPLVGVKANICVAGQAWTAGMRGRADRVASVDAEVIRALRQAGAGFLSRLTMDEAALGAATELSGFRATSNPAAPGFSVGGSSGGSAAAVACGAVPVALGSDTLGSVRIPAAYCGVLGLKPGRGVLPMDGVFPLADGFDTLGLLARVPQDISNILALFQAGSQVSTAPVYLARGQEEVACTPEVMAALATAERILKAADRWGGQRAIVGWIAPDVRKAAFGVVCARASATLAGEPVATAPVAKALAYGARLSAADLGQAEQVCEAASTALHDAVADGAVLMTPTTPSAAFACGTPPPVSQADFTVLANVSGLPAISVPITCDPLPCAVQLMGGPGQEGTLLSLADLLMAATASMRTQA
jgi:aspartyl-tRNA(Asn)/glutamyl-tRNA(Gln) amidotransferase subunit A